MLTAILTLLVALWVFRKVRRLQRRLRRIGCPTTDRALRATREGRVQLAQARAQRHQIELRDALWAARYPHGVIKYAGDDTTGMSVYEVDVKSWLYVRELEMEALGAYYHRANGTTNACGWEPIDGTEEQAAKLLEQKRKADEIVAAEMILPNKQRRTEVRTPLAPYDPDVEYIHPGADPQMFPLARVDKGDEWADVVLGAATTLHLPGGYRFNFDPDISYRVPIDVFRELSARHIVTVADVHVR